MSSYKQRKSHCGDEKVIRSSYLHNEISYTGYNEPTPGSRHQPNYTIHGICQQTMTHELTNHIGILTHWDWVTHICVSKLTIISWDNGLSPGQRQAIIWTNDAILLIRTLGTNLSIQENAFEIVVYGMASILSWPQCVKLNMCLLQFPSYPAAVMPAWPSGYCSYWPPGTPTITNDWTNRIQVDHLQRISGFNTLRPKRMDDIFQKVIWNFFYWKNI